MRIELCAKKADGGMTEQDKCEAGLLYNPNTTDEMKTHRFKIQDAICEYNKLKPSQVKERRDFLAGIFGKIGEKCNILPPFKCDYGFHIEVGENFFAARKILYASVNSSEEINHFRLLQYGFNIYP
jgi:maltose O-acetyltransferase